MVFRVIIRNPRVKLLVVSVTSLGNVACAFFQAVGISVFSKE